MSIPTPLLFRLRISWPRKVGVSALLLSGVFMIATAIVRAVQTLTGAPSVININRWGFRETAVGMIAVNAATLLPLFKRPFWVRGGHRVQWHHHHHHLHHQHGAAAAAAAVPEQEERNRRPSGGALLMKWDAALLWTKSVVSSSQGGSGGGAGSSIRRDGPRSDTEQLTVDTAETPDLEHGVVEAVGPYYELGERGRGRGREQGQDRETDKDALDKLNGATVELREIASASTEVVRDGRDGPGGPSEQGGDSSSRSPGASPLM